MKEIVAIWKPAWYELDQDIEVGVEGIYLIFKSNDPFRFATGLDSEVSEIRATVLSITHRQLGPIHRIDPTGLSYKIYHEDGSVTQIEAEQRPGYIEYGMLKGQMLSDLVFQVKMLLR